MKHKLVLVMFMLYFIASLVTAQTDTATGTVTNDGYCSRNFFKRLSEGLPLQ